MDKVRFGIVGYGNMGVGHAENFRNGKIEHGCVSAICDVNPDRIAAAKEVFGDTVKYFSDAEEMFRSGECDCVMIETPHYSHPDLAILAMDCGVHCIVEKPAGVYTLQVKKMLERAKSCDTVLGMMFNQRTNPAFKKMRELIMNGAVGEIKRLNWIITDWYRSQYYYDSGSWRATWAGEGGGVLYNQAPHQLDLFQWITGMMPNKVHAFCHYGKWHDIEVEDDVTCYLEYPNGATGVFITTTADAPGTNRFEVTGTKGTLIYSDDRKYVEGGEINLTYIELEEDEREYCKTATTGFGSPKCKPAVKVEFDSNDFPAHSGICENIAKAILGLEEVYAPAEDGIHGVMLANAMHLSSWTGKTVSLPIDDELFYEELKKKIAVSKPRKTTVCAKVEAQN